MSIVLPLRKEIIGALLLVLWCGSASAAEVTKVIDAFDGAKSFDGIAAIRFQHEQRSALILREWVCDPSGSQDATGRNPFCANSPQVLDTRQLRSTEVLNVLNLDLRAGLYHDLEAYATVPFVLGWQSKLDHDSGVGSGNSRVDSQLAPSFFSLPYQSANRVGLGDITLGLKFAPLHADRDLHLPSWVLGVEYLAPTGSIRTPGGTGVGGAVHELGVYTAISHRPVSWVEPYFRTHARFRFRSGEPFDYAVTTQTLRQPGNSLGITLGAEFYPWQTPSETGQYLSVDLGLSAEFTFEGREFTELFDALGSSDCDPAVNCYLTLYTRDEGKPGADGSFRKSDGVTDVEQYGRLGVSLGAAYQPLAYLKLRLGVEYQHVTSHFLTFADAGTDLDGSGDVQFPDGNGSPNEYNPKYNENIDDFGRRFRLDENHVFRVTFTIEGQL